MVTSNNPDRRGDRERLHEVDPCPRESRGFAKALAGLPSRVEPQIFRRQVSYAVRPGTLPGSQISDSCYEYETSTFQLCEHIISHRWDSISKLPPNDATVHLTVK